MIRDETDGLWIEHTETVGAHHELVFALLTTADGLTRWFPVAAEVDARPGGLMVLGWDEKMKRKTTVAILDYDAGGRVVWDWQASHQEIHAPLYWAVDPEVESGSIVTLRQGPFRDDRESLIAMAEEAQYWSWYLCNLRGIVEAKHDMRKIRPL